MLNALAAAPKGIQSPNQVHHRLRRGLPGYLILFAPHAFAPQRQYRPVSRLRHWCSSEYLRISPLHSEFHSPLRTLDLAVSKAVPGLSPGISPLTYQPPTRALRPVIPNNACPLRITAAAGTELAGASSSRYRHYLLPWRKSFTTLGPSSLTRHGWIRLSPIVQYSPLLPPVGVWAVSQSQCG